VALSRDELDRLDYIHSGMGDMDRRSQAMKKP